MLPLTIDTGPQFGLESFASTMSFGHPGISALEFAGSTQKPNTTTLSLRGKSAGSTQDENGALAVKDDAFELEAPRPVLQELSSQQRVRGMFINHTPRNFEIRPSKLANRQNTSSYASSEDSKSTSWTKQWHQSPPQDWNPEDIIEKESEHALKEEDNLTLTETRSLVARSHISSSSAAGIAMPPHLTLPDARHSQGTNSGSEKRHSQNTGKRRRRQTPFKISSPPKTKGSIDGRYSPLEPWVAYHRREASNSSMKESLHHRREASIPSIMEYPAKVNSQDVGDVSTTRAIQEYFDNQTSTAPVEPVERCVPASPENIPLPNSPEVAPPGSPTEPIAMFPIDSIAVPDESIALPLANSPPVSPTEPTHMFPLELEPLVIPQGPPPEIPMRSPKRLHTPSNSRVLSNYRSSTNSEFTSAARGQYSPYDKSQASELNIIKRRGPRVGHPAHAGSSKRGRMAPPILGHEALTATGQLNDLSFYLKNTGPPSDTSSNRPRKAKNTTTTIRKSSGLKIFKVRGKGKERKSLAARVGSVEGSPKRHRTSTGGAGAGGARSLTPSCAKEMVTSGGARHLRIVIPDSDPLHDKTVPANWKALASRRSKHASFTWTEEMLNPLASSAVENAIQGMGQVEELDGRPVTPPLRSPRREVVKRKPVPVKEHEHPLSTREEQTRARKLRDLKRVKSQFSECGGSPGLRLGDAGAGAENEVPMTPIRAEMPMVSAFSPCSVTGEREDEESEDEGAESKVGLLQQRVIELQRLNTELAEALARIVGYEAEDGDLEAGAVLRAYRQIRTGSGDSGFGYLQRNGRVFTS